jgi:hypothetical protein
MCRYNRRLGVFADFLIGAGEYLPLECRQSGLRQSRQDESFLSLRTVLAFPPRLGWLAWGTVRPRCTAAPGVPALEVYGHWRCAGVGGVPA